MEPVLVTIGGEAIAVPPILNFAALKRAWPAIKSLSAAEDTIERVAASVEIVSAALKRPRPELTATELEERLRPGEMLGLVQALSRILDASGLVPSGEAAPAMAGSTAISTGSSPNSPSPG